MSGYHDDTAIDAAGDGRWTAMPGPAWNIGDSANGGYVVSLVLRAFAEVSDHPDPLSVTAHFLRPVRPDGGRAEIEVESVRSGRTTTVLQGDLHHAGKHRLRVVAVFGDLAGRSGAPGADTSTPVITIDPPEIAPPADCADRSELAQGVALPILQRLDVRIRPEHAAPGGAAEAVIDGWIRLADGTEPSSMVLPLFADAFPPSLYPRFGSVGWVPTIELTVHVRRRPARGWVQARLECDDLAGGRMIETASLWDAAGNLVARSRQLGLLLGV